MSTTDFRSAVQGEITAYMAANHSAIPIQWDNAEPLNQDKAGAIWLDVEVKFQDAKNVTTGGRPRGRDIGVVTTNVYLKVGEGTAAGDAVVEGLRELLRNRRLGGGTLEFPIRTDPPPRLGWRLMGLKTPFRLDSA